MWSLLVLIIYRNFILSLWAASFYSPVRAELIHTPVRQNLLISRFIR